MSREGHWFSIEDKVLLIKEPELELKAIELNEEAKDIKEVAK